MLHADHTFKWPYLIILVPTLTELIENGSFPSTPRELITDLIMTSCLFVLIRALNKQHNRLRSLSETDPLIQALNRRKLETDLDQFTARSSRLNELITLVYLDIDRFKQVNDNFGHAEGDRLLTEVAKCTMSRHRVNTDFFYRLGGDEFALVLTNESRDDKEQVEQKVKQTIQALNLILADFQSSTSYGICYLKPGETGTDLMRRADSLMYKQKELKDSPPSV